MDAELSRPMRHKEALTSSRFVSRPALVLWYTLALGCLVFRKPLPAGAFLALAFFLSLARWWGLRAMREVTLSASCTPPFLYPGQVTEFSYALANHKRLPMPWLELSQDAPEGGCLLPMDDTDGFYQSIPGEEERTFCMAFPDLRGGESIVCAARWRAAHRGVYRPKGFLARSGDGFGLMQSELVFPPSSAPVVAVWPEKIPLDLSPFLRRYAEMSSASHGLQEDCSVLRGMRPYTSADSRKRINRRMEAKQPDDPQVNLFETVQPGGLLFVLDGESFLPFGVPDDSEALEDVMRILGSIFTGLAARGISCGLCLPAGAGQGPVSVPCGSPKTLEEKMYALSGYFCRRERRKYSDGSFAEGNVPSRFASDGLRTCLHSASAVYVLTAAPDALPGVLLSPAFESRITLLTDALTQRRHLPLASLKRCRR